MTLHVSIDYSHERDSDEAETPSLELEPPAHVGAEVTE